MAQDDPGHHTCRAGSEERNMLMLCVLYSGTFPGTDIGCMLRAEYQHTVPADKTYYRAESMPEARGRYTKQNAGHTMNVACPTLRASSGASR